MKDINLIFEAYRQIDEQSRVLRSPAYAQEYGGGGDFPNAPAGNASPYGYVYGNTPEQSDTFIRGVLQKLKAGPDPVLRRIEPVNRRGKIYSYYYNGTPESFKSRVESAIRAQLDDEGRVASNANIGYGVRVFLNKVLQKDLIPGEGGQNVTYVDGNNIPEPEEVAVEENPPEQLQEVEPEAEPEIEPEIEPEAEPAVLAAEFRLSDTYQLQPSDDVRIPPDLADEYASLINKIGRNVDATGNDIINHLRETLGSYTDAKSAARQMVEKEILVKQENDADKIADDFDPFSDIEDDNDYDIEDILTDIEREQAGGRNMPHLGLNDFE